MYTFRDCESHDFCICRLTFLKSEHSRPLEKKNTKIFAHILDLQEYGVTKKRVIITEMSKEVENNNIVRLNTYLKQYVSRRNVAVGGSYGGGGSCGRS